MKLLAAALLLALCPQDTKVDLKWKWQKGQEYVYKSSTKTQLDFGAQPIEQYLGNTYSMTITDVSEKGEASLTFKYLAIVSRGNGPTGEYDYDSEKDKEAPKEGPAAMQARIVGQSFTMKMTATGRVTEIQGYDKVLDAMVAGSGQDNDAMKAQLKQMFNNDSFKGMMQQMAPPLPEKAVGAGDGWETDFVIKMPMLGGMKFTQKSKLSALKEQNAHIDQDILVELAGDKDNPMAAMIKIKDAKGKASAVFSIEKGCFLSQKSAMEMTINFQEQAMPLKTVVELQLVSRK